MSYPGHEDFGRGDLYFTGAPMSAGAERVATGVLIERARDWPASVPGGPRDAIATRHLLIALADRLAELEALEPVRREVERQDAKHGPFQGATALGRSRLAVACLEDEVREVLDAWRGERKVPGMPHTREELIQVAAVAIRAERALADAVGE